MDKDVGNKEENKYEYKVNVNILVGTLKDNLIMIVNNPDDLNNKIEALYQ